MDQRPGRQKNVTGTGKDVKKEGQGLGTGPVGRKTGYGGRPGTGGPQGQSGLHRQGGQSGQRGLFSSSTSSGSSEGASGGGFGKILAVILAAVLALGGGGFGLSQLFGGSSENTPANSGGNGGSGGSVPSILSMFTGSGSESTGWLRESNVTKDLDRTTAAGAREKRTQILGNGKDQVTVMVYMCGTDLESKNGMASKDLQEMAEATISDKLNLLVYTGGAKTWKNDFVSNSVNQIYRIADRKAYKLVENDGSAAMTDPATLTKFITYCKNNYPANRYELIFWDHGGGSLTGYGYDEKNKSAGSMTLSSIGKALKNAGVTFDFIGFDACLMSTVENALMLDSCADYLIASEETEPGIGWFYTDWLTKLSADPSMPTVEIGKNIIDDFIAACKKSGQGQKNTLALTDLAELAHTVPSKLSAFAASASKMMQEGAYEEVSQARAGTKEFSSKIDQVDLVHFATNLKTSEGEALAQALLSAVKYNRVSSTISNAYGLSIYFPYKKPSAAKTAANTCQAIGLDSEYGDCIKQFASMEGAGQEVASSAGSSSSSPIGSLIGSFTGSSGLDLGSIGSLLGGLTGGDSSFFGRGIDQNKAAGYLAEHQFDSTKLKWTVSDGKKVISLTEEQWGMVTSLLLNVFYDDGEGYIDLGLQNDYTFNGKGELIGEYDGTWIAIDQQPVACYFEESLVTDDSFAYFYRVPVLLNGDRAELILIYDNAHPNGYIAGARSVYPGGETETVAKGVTEMTSGDRIEFIADFYTYDGVYSDTYKIGEMIWSGIHTVSDVYLKNRSAASPVYLFTDVYGNEFWSQVMD